MVASLNSIASRLSLRHFRLLTAIDNHGSVMKAAEEVAISQPGATKALKEIEAALGETLFVRTNRGLEANELGHCVIRYARLIQTDLGHLRDEMNGILEGYGGRLSVGCIMGAVPLVSEKISSLLAKQPELAVHIEEDTSGRLLRLLDDGRIDVAVCRTSVSHRRDAYDTLMVKQEKLSVVCNPAHPARQLNQIELSELAECPWVVCSANMPMRRHLEREFHEARLNFPLNVVETTSALAVVTILRHNPRMVALLSTDVAECWAGTDYIETLPVELKTRSEPYYLVTCRERSLSPAARLFREEFVNAEESKERAAETL